jgi:GNAT superfamily N-acetyltransferase
MAISTSAGAGGVELVTLRNGRRIAIRSIRPDDKSKMVEAFERLSPESRYRRFFEPLQRLSDDELVYLTEVDHRDHEALVALDESGTMGLGVARYVRSTDDSSVAEVAVTVVDDWQNMGIGTALISRLAERAQHEGIRRFSALVQADNRQVLDLIRTVGEVRAESQGAELLLAIDLWEEPAHQQLRAVLREAARSRLKIARRDGPSGRRGAAAPS